MHVFLIIFSLLCVLQEQKGIVEEMFQGLGMLNLGDIEMEQAKQILKDFLPSIDYSIQKYVNFAKVLPGFTELPMEDRIALLKGKTSHQKYDDDQRSEYNRAM